MFLEKGSEYCINGLCDLRVGVPIMRMQSGKAVSLGDANAPRYRCCSSTSVKALHNLIKRSNHGDFTNP